jgi:hypothetical protein
MTADTSLKTVGQLPLGNSLLLTPTPVTGKCSALTHLYFVDSQFQFQILEHLTLTVHEASIIFHSQSR